MKDAEIVAAIQEQYPKHSKAAYSLAKHTNETGVMLCPGAQDIRDRILRRKRYPENRVNAIRASCRMSTGLAAKVALKMTREHIGTVQDLLVMLLTQWTKEDADV